MTRTVCEAVGENAYAVQPVADAQCEASGWALALGCAHGAGRVVCPSCDMVVTALPHSRLGSLVLVVKPHRADVLSEPVRRVA